MFQLAINHNADVLANVRAAMMATSLPKAIATNESRNKKSRPPPVHFRLHCQRWKITQPPRNYWESINYGHPRSALLPCSAFFLQCPPGDLACFDDGPFVTPNCVRFDQLCSLHFVLARFCFFSLGRIDLSLIPIQTIQAVNVTGKSFRLSMAAIWIVSIEKLSILYTRGRPSDIRTYRLIESNKIILIK